MSNDVFAARDEFVARFAAVFKDEGWRADFKDSERCWSFERSFDNFDLVFVFSGRNVEQLTRAPRVNFFVGLTESNLNAIQRKIMPPVKGYEPSPVVVTNLQIKKAIPEFQRDHDSFIRGVSGEAIHWAGVQDIETCIQCFAKPWETEKQMPHLAALAYVGDFVTLMEYQEMFKRGRRANFYQMIQPDMIDRAVDIALERA